MAIDLQGTSRAKIRRSIGQLADILEVEDPTSNKAARQEIDIPLAAYHVSGEYAMVHAAAQNGWLELEPVAFEHIGAIKRAGADLILTYFSRLIAEGLQ